MTSMDAKTLIEDVRQLLERGHAHEWAIAVREGAIPDSTAKMQLICLIRKCSAALWEIEKYEKVMGKWPRARRERAESAERS